MNTEIKTKWLWTAIILIPLWVWVSEFTRHVVLTMEERYVKTSFGYWKVTAVSPGWAYVPLQITILTVFVIVFLYCINRSNILEE